MSFAEARAAVSGSSTDRAFPGLALAYLVRVINSAPDALKHTERVRGALLKGSSWGRTTAAMAKRLRPALQGSIGARHNERC